MKHIKLFESFESNEYYKLVTPDEWKKVVYYAPPNETLLELTISEISLLDRHNIKIVKSSKVEHKYEHNKYEFKISDKIKYDIFKTPDDYFFVFTHEPVDESSFKYDNYEIWGKIYRCDQIEGLVKLIEDKSIK